MEVIICASAADVGRVAAGKIAQVAREAGAQAVLGLATGSSPLALYEDLARRVHAGELDLSRAWGFALDEYVGIPTGHPESYVEVIRRTVTEPLGMDPERVFVPDGSASDLDAAAQRYEEMIAQRGGVDVQVLGVGANGHIGFNEPGSSFASRTRPTTLTATTRSDNSRFFDSPDQVPQHALTQGLGTIMEARHVVLVAQGANKAKAVAALVEGPVTASCPASILQFHRFATVVVETDAASALANQAYYREAFDNRPASQRFE